MSELYTGHDDYTEESSGLETSLLIIEVACANMTRVERPRY